MVARSNNRNNGANLGIAYVNANNALSNSNGNNWRSRISQKSIVERRRLDFVAKPETPLKADDTFNSSGQMLIVAVKHVLKRPASRAA